MASRGTSWLVGFGILIVCGAAVGVAAWQAGKGANNRHPVATSAPAEEQAVGVVVGSAEWREFRQAVKTSGSVYAVHYALVSARIPGTLDAVYVREGDRVEAGKTKLFQTDSLKLAKALAIAQENLKVAEAALREKEALKEKTLVAKEQAERDLKRYEELLAANGVSRQTVEHQRALVQQLAADLKHVETLIDLARAQLEQARLSVGIAEKDLSDSLVYAPISGVVEERYREPGEMAGAGTPVLKISDPTVVEIRVHVPQEYYGSLRPGQTQMLVRVGARELPPQPVSYKAPTIDLRSRTFEVRCRIQSPPEDVVPGALADVTIILEGRKGVGVPLDAVVQAGTSPVVFAVENERVRKVPVRLGLRTDGYYEVLEGISAGTPVVLSGQGRLDDGTRIRILSTKDTKATTVTERLTRQEPSV
ncbi:MAG: efflux RND transporter periplasmic adaptor subunit [Thermoguttaceae bacterium]|nr:efflux RND transporter periplasmic adaptor subunit [Thermoguttaceae bacterium]MDW8078330.1 efflux RND transporter periplasmic adaptor subunit [Thermoguttaceae bacterium]